MTDLVLATRNQAYGAYEPRQTYAATPKRALVLGVALCSISLLTSALLTWLQAEVYSTTARFTPVNVLPPPPVEQPERVMPPPLPKTEALKAPSTELKVPEIRVDEQVLEETPVATQEQLHQAQAGLEPVLGDINAAEVPSEPVAKAAPEVVEVKPTTDEPFVGVEQQPEFPGGLSALADFPRKTLRYPAEATFRARWC